MNAAAHESPQERIARVPTRCALAALLEAHRTRLAWTRGEGAEGCIDAGSSSAWSSCGWVASSPAGRFHIEVELVKGQRIGLRTLDSERARCRSLDDSLAVIVALLVEASDDMIADA